MARRKKLRVNGPRQLENKQVVPSDDGPPQTLGITTVCPRKWLFVDMETGQVWHKMHAYSAWKNVGYVDTASVNSVTILPSAAATIPRFDL